MSTHTAVALEDRPHYLTILSETLPTVIQTEAQNEEYLRQAESLLRREQALNSAEREYLRLLTLLIENFEEQHYRLPEASPIETILFLMDQHGLKQKDLSDVFGSPSITSEVLSGKRELNKAQIGRLSNRFHVSPELFF